MLYGLIIKQPIFLLFDLIGNTGQKKSDAKLMTSDFNKSIGSLTF